jgi:excisionase family DNA binding protein
MNTTNEVMTAKQAGEYLNMPATTVKLYCRRNQIPHIKLGRSYRFSKLALDKWMVAESFSNINQVDNVSDIDDYCKGGE